MAQTSGCLFEKASIFNFISATDKHVETTVRLYESRSCGGKGQGNGHGVDNDLAEGHGVDNY